MTKDPHHKREATKYENPIPSREYILSIIEKNPSTKHDLFDLLRLDDTQKKPLSHRLRAMVRDQQLSCNKNGVYRQYSNRGLLSGTVIANPKGFGFIALDKGGKDLRLSAKQMQLVFHGDKVKARLLNKKGDAEIVKVVETVKTLVGRLHIDKGFAYVIVDDKRIKHTINIPKLGKIFYIGRRHVSNSAVGLFHHYLELNYKSTGLAISSLAWIYQIDK